MKPSTIKRHRYALRFWRKLKRPTPKKWARIRTTCSILSGCLIAGATALNKVNITMPENFNMILGSSIVVFTALAAFAQAHDDIPDKFTKDETGK